jgi:hypothetical protein
VGFQSEETESKEGRWGVLSSFSKKCFSNRGETEDEVLRRRFLIRGLRQQLLCGRHSAVVADSTYKDKSGQTDKWKSNLFAIHSWCCAEATKGAFCEIIFARSINTGASTYSDIWQLCPQGRKDGTSEPADNSRQNSLLSPRPLSLNLSL